MLKLALLVAGLMLPTLSAAQEAAPAAATAAGETAKPVKAKKPRRICRNDPSSTTRMTSQTCHSADEWAAIDKASGPAESFRNGGKTTY